ncbi:Solute carrier 2, facilitated glucose transporter member 4 [Homalodisca vitripennis]|nr:Solute carrier 2, facilitated glucose transporter member 4 [Homalodisca vitripennis]
MATDREESPDLDGVGYIEEDHPLRPSLAAQSIALLQVPDRERTRHVSVVSNTDQDVPIFPRETIYRPTRQKLKQTKETSETNTLRKWRCFTMTIINLRLSWERRGIQTRVSYEGYVGMCTDYTRTGDFSHSMYDSPTDIRHLTAWLNCFAPKSNLGLSNVNLSTTALRLDDDVMEGRGPCIQDKRSYHVKLSIFLDHTLPLPVSKMCFKKLETFLFYLTKISVDQKI